MKRWWKFSILKTFDSDFYVKAQTSNWCAGSPYYISQQVNTLKYFCFFWLLQWLQAQLHFKVKIKYESHYLLCRGLINWLSLALNHPPGARCPFDASKLTTLGWRRPLTTSVVPSGPCAVDHHNKKPQCKCQGLLQSRDNKPPFCITTDAVKSVANYLHTHI